MWTKLIAFCFPAANQYESAQEENAQGHQRRATTGDDEDEYSASDEDSDDEEIADKENVSRKQRNSQLKRSSSGKNSRTKAKLPKTVVAKENKKKHKKGVAVSDESSALTPSIKSSRSALSDQAQKS